MGRLCAACLVLLLCVSCTDTFFVEVSIDESHPWERASGRQFWYTLVYQGEYGLVMENLSIGVKRVRVAVPRSSGTVIFAAYPLGGGLPMGGALSIGQRGGTVSLFGAEGPLSDALLHVAKSWPEPVGCVNYERLSMQVHAIDPRCLCVDWNRIATDIVCGKLAESSVKRRDGRDVLLCDVPTGRWVCELASLGSFTIFHDEQVLLPSMPAGLIRYLNIESKMELRLLVPDDPAEDPLFFLAPVDTLLAISDPAYHDLVGRSHDFP